MLFYHVTEKCFAVVVEQTTGFHYVFLVGAVVMVIGMLVVRAFVKEPSSKLEYEAAKNQALDEAAQREAEKAAKKAAKKATKKVEAPKAEETVSETTNKEE